ncbi:MAG: M14 family metallopeptidase, partial [Bacillota bacterium]|nr:M14 family metallopeptidase [Bacillota bacterium]
MSGKITSPEGFFGFELGSDRCIARWDRIMEYFCRLSQESNRIRVEELGKSTEGQPFLLVTISSPANLARLERLRQISLRLSDPRGVGEDDARDLAREGCAVVCQTMSLHANEIGGTQMSPQLAYDLVAGESADILRVLDNVVFLMVPCFNPDGQIAVTDWYNRYLDTEYEGTGLPWLYHKYAGHDNNRDAVMLNLVESQHVAKLMLRDWMPQVYQDHHHMGGGGIRLYVAPYTEPIRPHADPLVWREISWYGSHITYLLEEQGRQGVLSGAHWTAWGHLGFHRLTILHNIAGLLTESASAKLATPAYVHPQQLRGANPKSHPEYAAQTNFPNPWPGGWWRLRDIVDQQKITAWAILDLAARCKETVLWSAYLKARRQTDAGEAGSPTAYLIPAEQHDPPTARKLVRLLLDQGIEVTAAGREFEAGGCSYPAGTHAVFLAQPKRGVIINLLQRTNYPDAYWTRNPDGTPIVYDLATDTITEYMGVEAVPAEGRIGRAGDFRVIGYDDLLQPSRVAGAGHDAAGWVIDGRLNDGFVAVNRLLAAGAAVWRIDGPLPLADGRVLPPGAFYVENGWPKPGAPGAPEACAAAVDGLGLDLWALRTAPDVPRHRALPLRVGLYQRYWGGNMDEGWTRYVLERFEFPHCTVTDADFRDGAMLAAKIDVLVLPADRPEMIIGPTKLARPGAAASLLQRVR